MRTGQRRRPGWPTTASGRVSLAFAAAFVATVLWEALLGPLVGVLTGEDRTGPTDSWFVPLAMVVLVDLAVLAGVVARVRGERTVVAWVVLWASAAAGALWTIVVVGTFLSDG